MIHLTHSNESISINDDDDYDDYDDHNEQPADKVQGGGGKRPLGEKLPNGFEVTVANTTLNLTGAIELHRLVLKDYDQLLKRKDEITKTIIESTCSVRHSGPWVTHQSKEVSQPSLPLLPRRPHFTLPRPSQVSGLSHHYALVAVVRARPPDLG